MYIMFLFKCFKVKSCGIFVGFPHENPHDTIKKIINPTFTDKITVKAFNMMEDLGDDGSVNNKIIVQFDKNIERIIEHNLFKVAKKVFSIGRSAAVHFQHSTS